LGEIVVCRKPNTLLRPDIVDDPEWAAAGVVVA
jgi:hypothetical protein